MGAWLPIFLAGAIAFEVFGGKEEVKEWWKKYGIKFKPDDPCYPCKKGYRTDYDCRKCKIKVTLWNTKRRYEVYRYETTDYCNYFEGSWDYHNDTTSSYPFYSSESCPFIEKQFDCHKNGRPDKDYLKYRWKPNSCTLPKFNGKDFLRRFKGKRIMFIGDSMGLNQWQSLTCMLHTAEPHAKYTLTRKRGLSTFSFPSYNVSLMFSRNALLVDVVREKGRRILKLNSINDGEIWKGIDALIFNTWHWWLHSGSKTPWDVIQDGESTYKDMDRLVAYENALNTWARWVNSNMDTTKTKIFFQGVSPDHPNSRDWGDQNAKTCKGETHPLLESKYPGGLHKAEAILEKVIGTMQKKVHLLNVTTL